MKVLAFICLVAAVSASPLLRAEDRACTSEICRALNEVYTNMPNYIQQLEDQVCGFISNAELNKICHVLVDTYKPKLIETFKQQLQQEGSQLNCELGSNTTVYAVRDDCSSSLYCQTLQQVYGSLPAYVDQIEEQVCTAIPAQFLQKLCRTFVKTYKTQVVDALRQAIQEEGTPAGCVFVDGPTTAGPTTAGPTTAEPTTAGPTTVTVVDTTVKTSAAPTTVL